MERLVLFLFLLSSNLFADISGIVLDENTVEPLVNVNIRIKWTSVGTTTDNEGVFSIPLKKKQQYFLLVSMMGYENKEIEVTNPEENVVIYLEPEVLETPGVTVYARRIGEEIEKNPFSIDELLNIPLIKPDPIHAIQTFPGVTSPSDYFGWIFVRGGGGEENLYVWDGMELPTIYRFFGLESIVNPFIIDKFELFPGGFSCKYGNKLSSVITIHSKNIKKKTGFVFWLDPTEFSGVLESGFTGNLSFNIAVRKSFIGEYLSRFDIPEDVLIPSWGDFEGRIVYKYKQGEVFFQMLKGSDRARVSFPVESETLEDDTISLDWKNTNEIYGFSWLHSSEKLGTCRIVLSKTDSRNRFLTEGLADNHQIEENNEKSISFSFERRVFEGSFIECGINWKERREVSDVMLFYNETYLDFPDSATITGDSSGFVYGGYIENTSVLLDKLKLRTGVRMDKLSITDEGVTSPRFLISYVPVEGFETYLFWGHYFQFPKFCFLGDRSLDAASSHHYIFGTKLDLKSKWFLKYDIYYKDYEKLIVFDPVIGFENTGYGYAYGFDLFLRKNILENNFGWISYSYTSSKRKIMDYPFFAPYISDITHTFNAVYSLMLPYRVQLGIRYRFNTGRPMTPYYGRKSVWGDEWEICWGKFHSTRYPFYSRFDIKIEKKIKLGVCNLDLYLTVINILNRSNVQEYIIYNDNKNYRALYMLPFVPFIGIEGRF